MREILFRGKSKHGEWYFGFYTEGYYLDGTPVSWIDVVDRKKKETDSPTVIPETVGQFTGLTDKNGKKIFEGDIVKVTDDYGGTNFPDGGIGDVGFYDGLWYVSGEVQNGLNDLTKVYYVEVISNIHDNPELLGGDEEWV